MKSEISTIDKICGGILAIAATALLIWWVTVWLPERDKFLWSTHECFMANGCQELTDEPSINECWSKCSTEIRETQW